ncbi:hypothetical protein [Ornithinimicrobium cavernae]|nr:hypothetical protein [Ornithinimicrobium cavernae]
MVKVHSIRESTKKSPMVTWVPVSDAGGRTRMEMRWHVGEERRATPHAA